MVAWGMCSIHRAPFDFDLDPRFGIDPHVPLQHISLLNHVRTIISKITGWLEFFFALTSARFFLGLAEAGLFPGVLRFKLPVILIIQSFVGYVLFITMVQKTRRRQKDCNILLCCHDCRCAVCVVGHLTCFWYGWKFQELLAVFLREWIYFITWLIFWKCPWIKIWNWKDGGCWRPLWLAMDSKTIILRFLSTFQPFLYSFALKE